MGETHALRAIELQDSGQKAVLISGGEATVTVRNPNGCGGPNMDYVLGAALALQGREGIAVLACDTDGIDGSEDAAGGFVDETTLERCKSLSINLPDLLEQNRSYDALKVLGDLILTGPTRTNVNDFRAILIE